MDRAASIRNLLVRRQNAQIACSFICLSNGNILSRLQLNIAVNISIRGNNVDVALVIVNLEVSAIVVRQSILLRTKVKVQIVQAHNKVKSLAQARNINTLNEIMLIVENDITSNSRNIHLLYFDIISIRLRCLLDIASIGLCGKLVSTYFAVESKVVSSSKLDTSFCVSCISINAAHDSLNTSNNNITIFVLNFLNSLTSNA